MEHDQLQRTIIAPSILSADFSALGQALTQLESAGADWIHVDVMDGHFVPNLTLGPPVIESLRKKSPLPFDVHLMITDPDGSLKQYRDAGADIITVHGEACTHLQRTLSQIRALGAKAGVSLNPHTPLDCLQYILDDVDLILIMSVNPGFGGQSFIPAVLQKIRDTRRLIGDRPIHLEVDGGVTVHNAAEVRAAGATVLVAGSAVFGAPHMANAIAQLRGTASPPILGDTMPPGVPLPSSDIC